MNVAVIFAVVLLAAPVTGPAHSGFQRSFDFGSALIPWLAEGGGIGLPGAPTPGAQHNPGARGPSPGTTSPNSSHWAYGIWVVAYSGIMVREIVHNLSRYLHRGDGVAIVLHNGDFAKLNSQASTIHAALPNVTLRAYTSLDGGTGVAGGLSGTIGKFSPLFTQISADYEVNGPVEFSANYSLALNYFSNFSKIVRGAGFESIAYPSGRSVLGHQYGWNYSGFAKRTDGQTIQTQAYCGAPWKRATSTVWGEYNTSGVSMETLSLQISLGSRCTEWQAIHAAKYWRQLTHGNVFFWWAPDKVDEMMTILRDVER